MLIKKRSPLPLFLFLFLALTACGGNGTEDLNGPQVMETNPAPEATGVPLSGQIEATLSKGIDPATINTDTFILTGVSGEVTYQNGKAVFTPSIPLADGTTYHAVLTTGIRDLDGVPLPENFIWSFTTGATGGGGPDQTPPEIVSATPREGAANIPIDAPVRVVFSEPIRPETLRTDTFFIRGVPGEIRYDESTRTATLQPLAPLALQSRYEVTVTNQITDRAGNPLPAAQSWSFTTASVIDLSPPVILSTVPGDGETGVAVNSAIQAVFNKEIDEQSLPSNFVLQGPGGGEIASSIRYDSGARTATLTPSEALQPETTYQAIVRRRVSDFSGNGLTADVRWSFTTVRSDDQTPPGDDRPEVIERQPIGIDIPLESFVTVRFSKAIRPETLAGNFMITTRGRAISAEIGYNISSNTATMIPSRLRHGTTYTVVLTHDIRDLAGNRLEHTSWSFRTVNRPDDDDDD